MPGYEDVPKHRVLNHFFDPQQGGIALTVAGVTLGSASPSWVLEDQEDLFLQDYSLRAALYHHNRALTLTAESERAAELGALLEILGRSVHHIQDIAQPAHVRNDDHLPIEFDTYEAFTDNWFRQREVPRISPYGSPRVDLHVFNTARKFWSNAGRGLADFTSRNFVSKSTNFIPQSSGGFRAEPNHPLPVPTRSTTVPAEVGLPGIGPLTFIHSQIYDAYLDESFENDRASTYSFFGPEGRVLLGQYIEVMSLNRSNFLRNHEILLPRVRM